MSTMDPWQVVALAQARASPWRNGGGVTRELLTWPAGGDWAWRLSVADVERDGPFSAFDGVARWFAVLEGAGVRLDVDGQVHELTADSAPLAFDGAAATGCTLVAGPTRDFNLMTVRGRASASMQRVVTGHRLVAARPLFLACYAGAQGGTLRLDGETLQLAPHSLAWRGLGRGQHVVFEGAAALWMEIVIEESHA